MTSPNTIIADLQAENELLKQVEANLAELHNVALTENETLRARLTELENQDPASTVVGHHFRYGSILGDTLEPGTKLFAAPVVSPDVAALKEEIAELKRHLAVYEANEARFIAADKSMQAQLAESKAREALQIAALESVNRLVKHRYTGSREAMSELREATFDVHEALALQHDDT